MTVHGFPSTGCSRSPDLRTLLSFRGRVWLVILYAAAAAGCTTMTARTEPPYAPRPGDLLFQGAGAGAVSEAIAAVTAGVDGAQLSHVAMVTRADPEQTLVIEAVEEGVREVPLDAFLSRRADASGRPPVLVGRLRSPYSFLIPAAVEAARERLGAPYDKAFRFGDDAYYCAELIHEAFRIANRDVDVFTPEPMTFNDPADDRPHPGWTAYYQELGEPIPEGEPGINPGAMSRAPMVQIVHAYGRPAGWDGPCDE